MPHTGSLTCLSFLPTLASPLLGLAPRLLPKGRREIEKRGDSAARQQPGIYLRLCLQPVCQGAIALETVLLTEEKGGLRNHLVTHLGRNALRCAGRLRHR